MAGTSDAVTRACTDLTVRVDAPWLVADLGTKRRVLSFAPHLPGFRMARHVLMRQVLDAELGPAFNAKLWLAGELAAIGHEGDPAMMTSRGLDHHVIAHAGQVACVATVGLGNAERVGQRRTREPAGYGTINIVLLIDKGLSEAAQIEAMTIAAQARTAAVIDAAIMLPTGYATGTGTDCIAIACDPGTAEFAGTHTDCGEAIGRATYQAVLEGALEWCAQHRK